MITQTSEIAVKALVYLTLHGQGRPVTPHEIAEQMHCSATYLSKIMGQLVKVGLLKSQRGPQGGMSLARKPQDISLLSIVEGCQGMIIGPYCNAADDSPELACAFHQALQSVRKATMDAMAEWSLADMAANPAPKGNLAGNPHCRMKFLQPKNGAGKPLAPATQGRRIPRGSNPN